MPTVRPARPAVPRALLPLILTATLPLSGCTPILNGLTGNLTLHPNPTAPAVQGADRVSGTYTGTGRYGLLNNRYRLVLNVNVAANRADGVLTNTGNARSYAVTGRFVPVTDDGGSVDAELFEGGRKAGTLVARVRNGELRGTLATLAFAYDVTLTRQP
ncbi:hypothetical protein GCM10008939_01130 [Deinococcus aquiradiocola]|uniref:Uncharacterized protein n=2 Tax=Deinococcus aquiradiocola TaxID=393059 RepID=A0A917P4E9_9DEIO|nr:hypothetical protein GCM10008939_01130 [Deinococcus aquiradiocola]